VSGFETGNSQGIVSRGKQFGSILRGHGAPVPNAGVLGDIYIDVDTWHLFEKRDVQGLDPWGHYLFTVPSTYRAHLNYFGTTAPPSDLGALNDYYMQLGGYPNYGLNNIVIYGPKGSGGWGSGASVVVTVNTLYTAEDEFAVT
jgi:hypothetical protein